jgi:hypothetical protein
MYDGVNILKWNLKTKPFLARWVVQMEEDAHGLVVVEDHMLPWDVAGKQMYCCLISLVKLN